MAGVDACRAGRLVVQLTEGRRPEVWVTRLLREVLRLPLELAGVDIPLGLPPPHPREADRAARALLGRRASTVFPVPPKAVLEAPDHPAAVRRARRLIRRGISVQSYGLRHRILEADRHCGDRRLVKVHPEVSFPHRLLGPPCRLGAVSKLHRTSSRRIDWQVTVGDSPPRPVEGMTSATPP